MGILGILLTALGCLLWFANPFSFAWASPYAVFLESSRDYALLLLGCGGIFLCLQSMLQGRMVRATTLMLAGGVLLYSLVPPTTPNVQIGKAVCEMSIEGKVLADAGEVLVRAQVVQHSEKIIAVICAPRPITKESFWATYRSVRRIGSFVRYTKGEREVRADLGVPFSARLYRILEEVSGINQTFPSNAHR